MKAGIASEIYGELENNWCVFDKGIDFEGFVVRRKIL